MFKKPLSRFITLLSWSESPLSMFSSDGAVHLWQRYLSVIKPSVCCFCSLIIVVCTPCISHPCELGHAHSPRPQKCSLTWQCLSWVLSAAGTHISSWTRLGLNVPDGGQHCVFSGPSYFLQLDDGTHEGTQGRSFQKSGSPSGQSG